MARRRKRRTVLVIGPEDADQFPVVSEVDEDFFCRREGHDVSLWGPCALASMVLGVYALSTSSMRAPEVVNCRFASGSIAGGKGGGGGASFAWPRSELGG